MSETSKLEQSKLFDLATKFLSILTLPAIAWLISLSAERATIEIRLTSLEKRADQQEKDTKDITSLVQQNAKTMIEMNISLQYLRKEISELKKMLEQP